MALKTKKMHFSKVGRGKWKAGKKSQVSKDIILEKPNEICKRCKQTRLIEVGDSHVKEREKDKATQQPTEV